MPVDTTKEDRTADFPVSATLHNRVDSMPRTKIELPNIEYLSILDEDAKLDKALEPKIAPETLKTMYKYMLLARRTDERMLLMPRQGRTVFWPRSNLDRFSHSPWQNWLSCASLPRTSWLALSRLVD